MAQTYYSLPISPNMSETTHGYLICENVPICRSGFQDYQGSELIGFPGYEESWDLEMDKMYRVFRPKNEVLHPDTIKSFEGNSVVDEHPAEGSVHIDNDGQLNCGHIEHIRQGPDHDGEVTLIGDLHIKNGILKDKIQQEGVRDVSCGYLLTLRKNPTNGVIEMINIRGNHVAVVPKGRAGSRIAIRDSAPPEIKQRKVNKMSLLDTILGRGVKAYAADATDEDLAAMGKHLLPTTPAKDAAATDKEKKEEKTVEDKKPAMDAHRQAAHDALDRCMDAMKDEKKMGCDAFGKPCDAKGLKKSLDAFTADAEDAKEPEAADAVEELKAADEKKEEPAEDKEVVEDGEVAEKQINNAGESVFNAAKTASDSVRNFLKLQKPIVAKIATTPKKNRSAADQTMLDSYNQTVRHLNSVSGDAYAGFVKVKTPEGIPALATDSTSLSSIPVEDTVKFFEGVSYAVGKRRYEEHLAQKGTK